MVMLLLFVSNGLQAINNEYKKESTLSDYVIHADIVKFYFLSQIEVEKIAQDMRSI